MTLNVIVHIHHHFDGGHPDVKHGLHEVQIALERLLMTQAELTVKVSDLSTSVAKIGAETTKSLQMIADLQTQVAGADPALVAAVDALATQLQSVDDLVPDQPTP